MADSPFPADVVERAEAAFDVESVEDRRALHRALSVIADYLRSEEGRERVRDAVLSNSGGSLGTVATAVISALLGEH